MSLVRNLNIFSKNIITGECILFETAIKAAQYYDISRSLLGKILKGKLLENCTKFNKELLQMVTNRG